MRSRPTRTWRSAVEANARARVRACAAFTLAEVLAALAFMAIVIPVAMQGVQVATRAGVVSLRKAAAMHIAQRVLGEWIATGDSMGSQQTGTLIEEDQEYRWAIRTEPWSEDSMTLVVVEVLVRVQDQDYPVRLFTLQDSTSL